ncbi:YqiA/YcfP family alpha/beta fold hydrolase [Alteromonas facilis]|uniref:YqiA/YcfP family alpha/beta fold hydrolase n=1 Tax=Alteromonas facilis TaxID=2048004 RepID=UPI000C29047A|nr:YqiA/YcfP family alpha/beta fold hydrolase [Alteromonas facilis]
MTPVVYLHGFLSSPQSEKAVLTQEYVQKHLPNVVMHTPQIPNTIDQVPAAIHNVINPIVSSGAPLRLIGSSMGGFLSTWLIEQFGGKAVLINPAVAPYRLMQKYQGPHVNPYTNEQFEVTSAHTEQLKQMEPSTIHAPSCYKVLLQTGDETLDYRLAQERYQGADMVIEEGGNHSFVDFAQHLPSIFAFLLSDNGV